MLDDKSLEIIKKVLNSYLPDNYKAFIFGSRVNGSNRLYSDIDLGILGQKPIPSDSFVNLKQDLEDSDLPYRTDVVDFNTVSEKFKKQTLTKIIYI